MDLHIHWLTAGILVITEILTFLSMRRRGDFLVFRWYLVATAIRSALPYLTYGDSPWIDGAVLLFRALAVAELLLYLPWFGVPIGRIFISLACFQMASYIPLRMFAAQLSAAHQAFVFVRQALHVELFVTVLVAMLWFWFHNWEPSPVVRRHGWLMVFYLLAYSAVGFSIARFPELRCEALVSFDLAATALLALWCMDPVSSYETASA